MKIIRKILNLAIAALWLWVFSALEWITFTTDMTLLKTLVLTALVAWLAEVIIDYLYSIFIIGTLGLGCITLPFFAIGEGFLILWATSSISHWFTINYPFFWIGLLMSIAFGMLRIPASTSKEKKENTQV
jgi:hypothetical protein